MTIFDTCAERTRKAIGPDFFGKITGSILGDYVNSFGFNYKTSQYTNVIKNELNKSSIDDTDFLKILRTETTSTFLPSDAYIKEAFDELAVYETDLGTNTKRLDIYISKSGVDATVFKNNLMRLCGVSKLEELESNQFITGIKQAMTELISKYGKN